MTQTTFKLAKVAVEYRIAKPFPFGWLPSRLDMGADGTFTGHMHSPIDATIEFEGLFNGWDGSEGIILKASANLHEHETLRRGVPTGYLYVVEGIKPIVRTGQSVRAGEPIGVAVPNPYNGITGNIEWGVSSPNRMHQQSNAYARDLGQGDSARKMVENFAWWFTEVLGVAAPTSTGNAGRA